MSIISSEEIELTIERLPPTYIGPTWQRGEDGKFVLPAKTLGWEIAGWTHHYLLDPNSDQDNPKPWRFTNEQLRFILWWYAVDDAGDFVYRQGVLQRLKGWGKDPLLSVICLVELVGPSRFAGWNDDGSPKAKPHPSAWVQVAAVSRDQTKNTMRMFPLIMSEAFKSEFQIDAGIEFVRARSGKATLEAVTSNYRSLEGGRVTFCLLNETQHWVAANGGLLMYQTADFNAGKLGNRYLAITNAFLPGEDSVAERMREAWDKIADGIAEDYGLLYESIEAHEDTPLTKAGLTFALPIIRGDAWWVEPKNIIPSALKADVDPVRARRMYLNQIVSGDDDLVTKVEWAALECKDPREQLRPGDVIVMGFDGGKTQDATALVAIRIRDGFIQPLCIEEAPHGSDREKWEVDREKVDAAVHQAFRLYKVVGFYADVSLWESYITQWTETYRDRLVARSSESKPIDWDMRGAKRKVTFANEALLTAIRTQTLSHRSDGDRLSKHLRRHVLNAKRRENEIGVSFGKASRRSPKKVDGYAALMIAYAALTDYRNAKKSKTRSGRGWSF